MIQELLLALSGHSSPILSKNGAASSVEYLLDSAEKDLLKSIACLGSLETRIREAARALSISHPSFVCRAVATAAVSTHLGDFQRWIVTVEEGILEDNSLFVGAYSIVPLTGLANAFNEWERILNWLHQLIVPSHVTNKDNCDDQAFSSGAKLIDNLRVQSQTGFPYIRRVALDLVTVAESAWLEQSSTWLLYGNLPISGSADFFIQRKLSPDNPSLQEYEVVQRYRPDFLSITTANSILFIGKSLNYIQKRKLIVSDLGSTDENTSLLLKHYSYLSSLKHPISSSSLSRIIGAIRTSLAQNALQKLLPVTSILQILKVLQGFFLLGQGEFSVALIGAADDLITGRHRSVPSRYRDAHRLGGVMIKEGEVTSVLNKTWAALAAVQNFDDDEADAELDLARDFIQLSIKKSSYATSDSSSASSVDGLEVLKSLDSIFEDVLLGTPTSLTINIPSPLDLFLTQTEVNAYSLIYAYLISIRRSHLHLSDVWKLATLRRVHPAPNQSIHTHVNLTSRTETRLRANQRSAIMRANWAVISSAAFFLAQLGEYLQGEVAVESWQTFRQWIGPNHDTTNLTPSDPVSAGETTIPLSISNLPPTCDPELLTFAHRTYLTALIHSLLLDDTQFTKSLRSFITRCDHIVALLHRLSVVTGTLEAEGGEPPSPMLKEYSELLRSLKEVRGSVQSGLEDLMHRLRELDGERIGRGTIATESAKKKETVAADQYGEVSQFLPWKGTGVNKLLIKLDFGGVGSKDVLL